MFLALTYDIGQAGTEIFRAADEHAFFERYLCRPVEEWLDAWNPEVLTILLLSRLRMDNDKDKIRVHMSFSNCDTSKEPLGACRK